ncbi:hypothetical protein HYW58_00170 [Candidatus Kaiserbacteria bacterium]|nr:hypothetical protein [Candidatus Kaiserbacteria bacterium]
MGVVMLCAALVSLYIYFVGKSIVNVVVREETELRIGEVNSLLSELEREYLTKKDAMSMKFAEEKGYYPISHKLFVNRGTFVGRSLSQDNNEI